MHPLDAASVEKVINPLADIQARLDDAEAGLTKEVSARAAIVEAALEKNRRAGEILKHANETCGTIKSLLAGEGGGEGFEITSKEAQLRLGGVEGNLAVMARLLDQLSFLFLLD